MQTPLLPQEKTSLSHLIGWVLTIFVPFGALYLTQQGGLDQNASFFIATVGAAVTMWLFNLVPFVVPSLAILLICLLFDIAPREVVLAGFTSEGLFLCLGIFIMSAQIFSSGLVYRFALSVLRALPASHITENLTLFFSGSLLTIFLPSPLGRSALVTPLLLDMVDDIPNLREKRIDITPLIISALHGVTLLTTIFLTGNPLNMVMLDFFNAQVRARFPWGNWLQASALTGILLLAGYLLVLNWQTRKSNLQPIQHTQIDKILGKMGPVTAQQWSSVIALGAFIVGVFTEPFHGIPLVWLTFGIALALMLYGAVSLQELKSNVDWPVLLFIAALSSWTPILTYLKLDTYLVSQINLALADANLQLSDYTDTKFIYLPFLLTALALFIIFLRLPLPGGPTFVVLMSAIIPIVSQAGISPWVAGFCILTISEGFFVPHQHGVYTQILSELDAHGLEKNYNKRDLLIANSALMLVRIVAIIVSLYYWKALAIL